MATLGNEELDINAYNFDPTKFLNDLKEGTDVKYELKDNEVVITLANGNQVDTTTRSANISYPLAWFNDDITIDTYYGYDIKDLINLTEDTTILSDSLEEDILTVVVSNGDKEVTIQTKVNVIDSSPYPITCVGTVDWNGLKNECVYTFLNDKEAKLDSPYVGTLYETYTENSSSNELGTNPMIKVNEYEFYMKGTTLTSKGVYARAYYKCDIPHPFK